MTLQLLMIGKPNSGKSLLFNRLTGMHQKVANFPGVTVDLTYGTGPGACAVIDFPGTYSLNPLTKDEQIAVKKLHEALNSTSTAAIVCVLDATRLQRSLVVGIQALKLAARLQKPMIFALNMIDAITPYGTIDAEALARELGAKVIAVSARTNQGIADFQKFVGQMAEDPQPFIPNLPLALSEQQDADVARTLGDRYGIKADFILKNQNYLDRFFLSQVLGSVAFVAIMTLLFQAIFTWSAPLMNGVDLFLNTTGMWVASHLAPGVVSDFVKDAIFGGLGSFLVFVPQIFVLTFMIGLLEDSGYLARATIICHKPLSFFGLSGKSFVPLLSGFACAIPALSAARTIESPRRRLLTLGIIPLMACSARLPVYSLLISTFVPPITFAGGLIGYQGVAFSAIYFLGIIVALIVSAIVSRTALKRADDAPFILELPPYRLPHWLPLMRRSSLSAQSFIRKAGGIIFTVSVIVWVLGYFPNGSGHLESSWLGQMGQWIEPLFKPLNLDWRFGVAILSSFVAREVFVGILGTLFGIESADEHINSLATNLHNSGFTLTNALSLLVFYAIALQCTSTLVVMKKESGSLKLPIITLLGYGALAYTLAFMVTLVF